MAQSVQVRFGEEGRDGGREADGARPLCGEPRNVCPPARTDAEDALLSALRPPVAMAAPLRDDANVGAKGQEETAARGWSWRRRGGLRVEAARRALLASMLSPDRSPEGISRERLPIILTQLEGFDLFDIC